MDLDKFELLYPADDDEPTEHDTQEKTFGLPARIEMRKRPRKGRFGMGSIDRVLATSLVAGPETRRLGNTRRRPCYQGCNLP